MKKVLLTATVQSHICQFHKPLVDLLHEHNYEVHVAAADNLAEKNGLKLDFADKVFNVPFARSPFNLKNINAYKQLKKIIDSEQYEVIHCNTPVGGVVTRLASSKARRLGSKVFYTAHGFHFYEGAPKINWMIYYPIEKWLAHKTDKLITIVNEDYNRALKKFSCSVCRIHGVGVDGKRYYPVDEETKNVLRQEMGFKTDQKIILCIGELLENKNQQMAINAMKEVVKSFPDAKLLIAGNGSKHDNLVELINTLGLQDNIKLLGYVTNLEIYQRISDLLVSCSFREGLPLNVIEAMMSGNPVVLSRNRGHKELIDEGNNGYMVECNDSEKMAEHMISILSVPETYSRFSKNAITLSQIYEFEFVKKELKEIYEL